MHKRIVNEAIIDIALSPKGPILIKASEQRADPIKPDMEFVETIHAGGKTVYLPGSSLKGVLRAHSERIVRTVGGAKPGARSQVWSCDPLQDKYCHDELKKKHKDRTSLIYKEACHTCKTFGSTSLASHFRIRDAYPMDHRLIAQLPPSSQEWAKPRLELKREERNGVAIDRVFGSVAAGPFNYEVLTSGVFTTAIYAKNFSLWQLGLIALTLRDLKQQRVAIGFAKSRGMGQVDLRFLGVTLRYPGCEMKSDATGFAPYKAETEFGRQEVVGVGALVNWSSPGEDYGFPPVGDDRTNDEDTGLDAGPDEENFGFGVVQRAAVEDAVIKLFRPCVSAWRKLVNPEERP
jgi:CRISPR-associated RAMP protein (TIGR02581 family)